MKHEEDTQEYRESTSKKEFILGAILFMIGIGIGNGMFSYAGSCHTAYLDFRKPIHYIVAPHTFGYYLGRVLSHSYGEDKSYSNCENIFNHTLEGPKE